MEKNGCSIKSIIAVDSQRTMERVTVSMATEQHGKKNGNNKLNTK